MDPSEEAIEEPREVDVLCGRGGLSNHHPGNEWYRRLIRSNRPLYRACPKHTKLLVSKAIVQAVEQQGGRFLEKGKDGAWYRVPYKRAVDKTSQGLREKERDDDDDVEGKEATVVPDSFSGRSKTGPNLSDLADVAIAHAIQTETLPKTSEGYSLKRPYQMMNTESQSKRYKPEGEDAGLLDDTPLPPTLEPRQSSMFRLLRQSTLFSTNTKSWDDALAVPPTTQYPTKLNNLQLGRKNQPLPHAAPKDLPAPPPAGGLFSFASGIFAGHPQEPTQAVAAVKPPPVDYGASAPPPFTRLTSQVSDWLTSFWPLPNRQNPGENHASQEESAHISSDSIKNQLSIPAPVADDPAFPITRVPMPKPKAAPPITVPPLKGNTTRRNFLGMEPELQQRAPVRFKSPDSDQPIEVLAAMTPVSAVDPAPWAARVDPPSELEHTASTTLLRLAGSQLFSGLTTFFDRPTAASTALDHAAAQAGGEHPAPRHDFKVKSSLLDDFEETPEEARMRTMNNMGYAM